jgi:hypothetical protein
MGLRTKSMVLRRLREHLDELASLTEGLTPELLKERPGDGRWSLHELGMHLAEVQDVFSERVARMLVEERPEVVPFVPDAARREGSYLTRNFAEGMRRFRSQRETLLALLASLTDRQWDLEGDHPEIRHYTVERCMESLMRHEEHHLYTMFNVFFGIRE